MRKIKFRVAELSEGKFVGFLYLDPVKESFDSCWLRYDDPDIVIQQFTGLTDRFGKEIFEGDIVKSLKMNLVDDVRWNNGSLTYKWGIYDLSEIVGFFEIIGNIYENENPELLGGSK